jgi:hypothetical protein
MVGFSSVSKSQCHEDQYVYLIQYPEEVNRGHTSKRQSFYLHNNVSIMLNTSTQSDEDQCRPPRLHTHNSFFHFD